MVRSHTPRSAVRLLPARQEIERLLKKFGDALTEPCPSTEDIILYSEESDTANDKIRLAISRHIEVCLDCYDKLRWLQEPDEPARNKPLPLAAVYVFQVRFSSMELINEQSVLAYAASSNEESSKLPPVPYIASDDNSFYGELGQDLDHHLFLFMDRAPSVYQWHAVQVKAITRDRQTLLGPCRALTNPRLEIACRSDIHPEDFERVELHFFHLRPR